MKVIRDRIQTYIDFIKFYQLAHEVHLVSNNDLETINSRHVNDCTQLFQYYKPTDQDIFMDLGCGAGFFGILSLLLYPNSKHHVILCDKDKKKKGFLHDVVDFLKINNSVTIHDSSVRHFKKPITHVAMRAVSTVSWFVDAIDHLTLKSKVPINAFLFKTQGQIAEWENLETPYWTLENIYKSAVLDTGLILNYVSKN